MRGYGEPLRDAVARFKRQVILDVIHAKPTRAAAAKELGMSREGLWRACIRLGIEPHHRKVSLREVT